MCYADSRTTENFKWTVKLPVKKFVQVADYLPRKCEILSIHVQLKYFLYRKRHIPLTSRVQILCSGLQILCHYGFFSMHVWYEKLKSDCNNGKNNVAHLEPLSVFKFCIRRCNLNCWSKLVESYYSNWRWTRTKNNWVLLTSHKCCTSLLVMM